MTGVTTLSVENKSPYLVSLAAIAGDDFEETRQFEPRTIKAGEQADAAHLKQPGFLSSGSSGWVFFSAAPAEGSAPSAYGLFFAHVKRDGKLDDTWARKISRADFDSRNTDARPLTGAFGAIASTKDKLALLVLREEDVTGPRLEFPTWMHDLANHPQYGESIAARPLADWVLPGSHDSAAYFDSLFPPGGWNWRCQLINLHDQAAMGIRAFDLRLKAAGSSVFEPFHGIASPVGDQLAATSDNIGKDNFIAAQLKRFMDDNPGEILVVRLTTKGGDEDALWSTWFNLLGDYLIPAESARNSYQAIKKNNAKASLVLACVKANAEPKQATIKQQFDQLVWNIGSTDAADSSPCTAGPWRGDNDPPHEWVSKDPRKVIGAIEAWIKDLDKARPAQVWDAQTQLTTTGAFDTVQKEAKLMNPFLLDFLRGQTDLQNARTAFLNFACIIQTDLTPSEITWEMIKLNLERQGPRGGSWGKV